MAKSNLVEFHPLANIFPLIEGVEFDALVADVREQGLRTPIVLFDGAILDGRNRYRACLAAGIEPRFETYDGTDPVGYVISLNIHRRHLNESQRAMVAARLANLSEGRPSDTAQICAVSQTDAAALLNVSRRSVQSATAIRNDSTPELIAAVESGRLAVSVAEKMVKATPAVQRAIVEKVNAGVKPTEAARQVTAAAKAEQRVIAPSGKYRVIYADPPWSYGNTMPDFYGEQRDHYPVMSLSEICDMPVQSWVRS